MSVGPLGVVGGVAGAPLAQTRSSDLERLQHDTVFQQRQVQADQRAESAAGIGLTDGQDNETSDRDADGRRLWERSVAAQGEPDAPPLENADRRPKDASGQSGMHLDLMG